MKKEAVSQAEFDGLVKSGRTRLADARTPSLAIESRFDLAYNASHALALAALRWHGYRSENRYLVFQCLEQTLGLAPERWRVPGAVPRATQRGGIPGASGYRGEVSR